MPVHRLCVTSKQLGPALAELLTFSGNVVKKLSVEWCGGADGNEEFGIDCETETDFSDYCYGRMETLVEEKRATWLFPADGLNRPASESRRSP